MALVSAQRSSTVSFPLENPSHSPGKAEQLQVGQPAWVLVDVIVLLVSNKGEKLYIEKSLLSALAYFFISDEGTQSGPRGLGCSQNSRCPVTNLVLLRGLCQPLSLTQRCRRSPSVLALSPSLAPGFCSSLKMSFGGFPPFSCVPLTLDKWRIWRGGGGGGSGRRQEIHKRRGEWIAQVPGAAARPGPGSHRGAAATGPGPALGLLHLWNAQLRGGKCLCILQGSGTGESRAYIRLKEMMHFTKEGALPAVKAGQR